MIVVFPGHTLSLSYLFLLVYDSSRLHLVQFICADPEKSVREVGDGPKNFLVFNVFYRGDPVPPLNLTMTHHFI